MPTIDEGLVLVPDQGFKVTFYNSDWFTGQIEEDLMDTCYCRCPCSEYYKSDYPERKK